MDFTTHDALKGQETTAETTKYAFTDKNVEPGKTYEYTLTDVDYKGRETRKAEVEVKVEPCEMSPDLSGYFTGEAEGAIIADGYTLSPVYPNPFNTQFTIPFTLTEPMKVAVELYGLTGRWIMTITDREFSTGFYNYTINTDKLSSGIYFIKTSFGTNIHFQKLVLMK